MKIYKDGKEVTEATVVYDKSGNPEFVVHGGLRHLAKFFTFTEDKPVKKTRTKKTTKTK